MKLTRTIRRVGAPVLRPSPTKFQLPDGTPLNRREFRRIRRSALAAARRQRRAMARQRKAAA